MTYKLEIIDYFDSLVNDVDLKAEILFTQIPEKYQDYINIKRKLFIDEIEQVKWYNLSNLNKSEGPLRKESMFKKYCFLLEMHQMNGNRIISYQKESFHQQREDKLKNVQLYNETVDKAFGILIILDGYLSDQKLSLYRELLHFHECYFPYEDDEYSKCKDIQLRDITYGSQLLNQPYKSTNSIDLCQKISIFTAKSQHLGQLNHTLCLQYDIFKQPNGFIIKTNLQDLFKVNYLTFYRVKIDSISDQALELLSGDITSLYFDIDFFNINQLNSDLNFLHWLQANVKFQKVYVNLNNIFHINIPNFDQIPNLCQLSINYDIDCLSDIVPVKNLANLRSLNSLSISNGRNVNLMLDTFGALTNLTELKLASNGISSIPARIFSDLTSLNRLDLNENKLDKLDSEAFYACNKLKHLNLGANQLESLAFFEHLGNLLDLKLPYNKLTHLSDKTFRHLSNLERLELNDNSISSIDPDAFGNLNKLAYLDLSSNEVKLIDSGWFAKTTGLNWLNFGQNQIESVNFDSVPSLKVLDLSFNKSLSLSKYSLVKLTNLEELYMSYCSIKRLMDVNLEGLVNLEKIYLQCNDIHSLESNIFPGLARLGKVDLGANYVSELGPEVFAVHLAGLTSLHLTCKNPTRIPEDTFRHLINLNELRLTGVMLDSPGLLANMGKLLDLDLSFSSIIEIRSECYEKLMSLTNLTIDQNQIACLQAKMFSTLVNLERLSISGNQIQRVDQQAFEGLANLRYLRLSDNKIDKIPNGTFHSLQNLQKLLLDYNQIENLDFLNQQGLINLKYLILDHNKIQRIYSDNFCCLYLLHVLKLGSNLIREIDANAFKSQCSYIKEINLLKNPIESIDFSTFSKLGNLKVLVFDDRLNATFL